MLECVENRENKEMDQRKYMRHFCGDSFSIICVDICRRKRGMDLQAGCSCAQSRQGILQPYGCISMFRQTDVTRDKVTSILTFSIISFSPPISNWNHPNNKDELEINMDEINNILHFCNLHPSSLAEKLTNCN